MYEEKSMNVPAGYVDTSMKGGMLKVNTRYERKSEREGDDDTILGSPTVEKYQIFDETDRLDSIKILNKHSLINTNKNDGNGYGKLIAGKFVPDTHESAFVEAIKSRDKLLVWIKQVLLLIIIIL